MAEYFTHNSDINVTNKTVNGSSVELLETVQTKLVKPLNPHFEINEINDIAGTTSYGPYIGDIINVYTDEGLTHRYIIV